MKYSASTGGFYDTDIHGDNIPADAVDIAAEEHAALLTGQSSGKRITADADGKPVLTDPPPPSIEQILLAKKAQRQAIVDAITVTTVTGNTFDGNEEAQSRMSRAIQTAEIAGIESTTWVLANNVPTLVTLPELKEALVLSMQAMGEVWATPYEV